MSGTSEAITTTVNVFHSTQSGGGAKGNVNIQDATHYYDLQFDAWENKSSKSRTASLYFTGTGATFQTICQTEQICAAWDYNTWTCTQWETQQYCYYDESSKWFIQGYGDIPNEDFRVGTHTAHLTTDLSKDTSFTAYRCAYDNWFFSCAPLTGTIDVVWQDNGVYSSDNHGTSSWSWQTAGGEYTTHSSGHSSEISANATGTFLGDAVFASGAIDQSKETSVSKDIEKGPPVTSGDGGLPDAGYPPPPPPPP